MMSIRAHLTRKVISPHLVNYVKRYYKSSKQLIVIIIYVALTIQIEGVSSDGPTLTQRRHT
jgi:hypothetical protein